MIVRRGIPKQFAQMMEPQPLQYVEIRSEGGEQGERQNSNMDEVSLVEGFQLDYSLLPEKINAVLTSQVGFSPLALSWKRELLAIG